MNVKTGGIQIPPINTAVHVQDTAKTALMNILLLALVAIHMLKSRVVPPLANESASRALCITEVSDCRRRATIHALRA